jgi:hypothetical protein
MRASTSLGLLAFVRLALGAATPAATPAGTFSALSMNVAGLPQILQGNGEDGDKTTNTMIIGQVRLQPSSGAAPMLTCFSGPC